MQKTTIDHIRTRYLSQSRQETEHKNLRYGGLNICIVKLN